MSPGSTTTLTCIVDVIEGLIVQPNIAWTKQSVSYNDDIALNSISVEAVRTNNTVILSFDSINTSDAGQYTCTATVDISAINVTVTNDSMVDIRVKSERIADTYIVSVTLISTHAVPSPTVSLSLSSADDTVNSSTSQTYLAGSTLTITCVIDIPFTVNTPFDVEMMWSKDDDDDFDTYANPRINITMVTMISTNRYQSQLVFSTLSSSMDSGSYECSIGINSNNTLLYVEDSALVNESTTVSVKGKPKNEGSCIIIVLHYVLQTPSLATSLLHQPWSMY